MGLLSTIGAASGRAFGLTRVAGAIRDAYFNLTTLLLPGNGTNGAQNNTFLDSSSNNFTITRNGNTTQGTFSPFSQTGWSNYFNGTNSDGIEIPNNAAFNFGTGDVTIEAWVYLNSTSAIQNLIDCGPTGGSGFTSWVFDMTASGFIRMNCYVSGNYQAIEATSNALSPNQWNHVAFTRASGTNRLFVNGALCTATSTLTQAIDSGGYTVIVGRGKYVGFTRPSTGYFSNVRITKGGALYTAAFTPSTTPLTTTVSAGTVSLLTCQSNRFIDNSSNAFAITPSGTPSVQAFSPFAPTAAYSAATVGGSGYFDGSGDFLSIAANAAFNFGAPSGNTNDFTIEMWVYPTRSAFVDFELLYGTGGSGGQDQLNLYANGTAQYYDGTNNVTSPALVLNQWNHVAVVRNGASSNNLRVYANGVSGTAVTSTNSLGSSVTSPRIGLRTDGVNPYQGYISSVRVVKGTAVYTGSTFTVPSAPLTAITNTSVLLNYTNAGITDATAKNDLETVGNAQISTTQSKFGGSSMSFDGTDDYLFSPQSNNPPNLNVELVRGDFTIEFWFRANTVAPTIQGLIVKFDGDATSRSEIQYMINLAGSSLNCNAYQGAANNDITFTSAISANTWYHVAFVRSGNSFYAYLDGARNATIRTITGDLNSGTNWPLFIGRYVEGGTAYHFNGFIDDLRITKFARYSGATITVPTASFPLQ